MGFKSRSVLIFTLLISAFIVTPVFASDWSMYHNDPLRQGVNTEENLNAANIGLIWTFPRFDKIPSDTGGYNVVDIMDSDSTLWGLTGGWNIADANYSQNYYGNNSQGYQWTANVYDNPNDTTHPDPTATARWHFPAGTSTSGLVPGNYLVQVWFPSSPINATITKVNTSCARYTIHDANGDDTTFVIDQRVGGQWVTLGSSAFNMGIGSYIELSNLTDEPSRIKVGNVDKDVIVCADAVRFAPPTGLEIYASPVAGTLTDDITSTPIPVVWIPTIENSVSSGTAGVKDFGSVYCVRSYKGELVTDVMDMSQEEWDANKEITGVGTAIWRYPHGGGYDSTRWTLADRGIIDGPIGRMSDVGGVFSTPALITSGDTRYLIFGGMDGQVYCLNADSGELVWKGPGVTISEEDASTAWTPVTGRTDAMGASFRYAKITDDKDYKSSEKVEYDIDATKSNPGEDAGKETEGHFYAIYAWIPAVNDGEPLRSKDALYTIESPSGSSVVRINQSETGGSDTNTGRWVRIGGKYWNPTKVVLSNQSQMLIANPQDDDVDRVVVADAIMVIPEEIQPFSYSSVVSDGTNVYIGNPNGRIYALKLEPKTGYSDNFATELAWTYPPVQTKNPADVSDPVNGGAAAGPLGQIVASPTLTVDNNRLIVPCMDGKVYSLRSLKSSQAELLWIYDPSTLVPTDSTTVFYEKESFSSSAAICGNIIYVPSTGGRMHAIKDSNGVDGTDGTGVKKAESSWVCPEIIAGNDPLSAFRFSTPAVYTSGSDVLVFCGSTGGQVYGFSDTAQEQIDDDNFTIPKMYAPVQGSVAIDQSNIYIPSMGTGGGDNGGIWWTARDGKTSYSSGGTWVYSGYSGMGQVFSSPAVANTYVYVGTSKGRLCAFSDVAFGGKWVGGTYADRGNDPFPRADTPSPATSCQIDIFTGPVWDTTYKLLSIYNGLAATKPLEEMIADAITNYKPAEGADPL
jgi:hypothetical protein